jgi:hypothetical protein
MTDLTDPAAIGLFVDDDTLHRLVAPYLGQDRFWAMVVLWEEQGFPRKLKAERGRYWSACVAWLDGRYGVDGNASTEEAEDGAENFDAAPGRKARAQEGPQRSAVLDRAERGARHQELPGAVHRLADRRRR